LPFFAATGIHPKVPRPVADILPMTGDHRSERPRGDYRRLPAKGDASPQTQSSLARIRDRIREGAYDDAAVLEAVACRILRSGDL
jgi:hypothetical protein